MPVMDNTHALLVGIANYQAISSLPPIVIQDVTDIHELLIDPGYCGYAPGNVTLLQDEQATKVGILGALGQLAERCNQESTVLVYISSHGGQIASGPHAGEYLLPVDTANTSLEAFAESAISGAAFTNALRAIPARKLLVIFDCCHAGGIGQPKDMAGPAIKAGLPESYYEALTAGRGRVILASSRSGELSWTGKHNSVFTQHLLAGLRGGIPSEDGLIRIFDLFEYIQPRVTADRPTQHPVFKADLEENFPVALYLGKQKGIVPKDDQGFLYDAYISYVDQEPDATWVWQTLLPRLKNAGLRVAVSGDVEEPGVARVITIERGVQQAKRVIVVLSKGYLADNIGHFENTIAQTMDVQEGTYRLLPLQIEPLDSAQLPLRLRYLTLLNLAHPQRAEREFDRLVQAVQKPLPRR
jgi:hypothetical protein